MRASDFKIGNYVRYQGDIRKIEAIHQVCDEDHRKDLVVFQLDFHIEKDIIVSMKDCLLIELNEQHLMNFCFKSGKDKSGNFYSNSKFKVYHLHGQIIPNLYFQNSNEWVVLPNTIYFINQLQNLISCLSTEKLTFKIY